MAESSPDPVALVQPASSFQRPHLKPTSKDIVTADSFQNFLTRTGVGTGNVGSVGTYGFNPITRNRVKVEWAYRGSWIVGTIVDCVAEDMTREGVEIQCDAKPEQTADFEEFIEELQVWGALCETIKWSRLYGGALGFLMIDGQNSEDELDPATVSQEQFRGILPLDRWAVWPTLTDLVTEYGPHFGKPRYYEMHLGDSKMTGLPNMRIHYSRVIRLEGVKLPYWQQITENGWGQSEIERLWDRLIAFDSATDGAAQLVYKAHLRTYSVEDLRKIIAVGGPALDALIQQMQMIRRFQSNEGMTLMDAKDKFEVHPYSFTGLDLVLLQFGQQLSGASQIPLVRLFGQSPAGLNATGESDLRTYYDGIKRKQKASLGFGLRRLYHIAWRSKFGEDPPKGWKLEFRPLWQMDDEQRANAGERTVAAIMKPYEEGVTARSTTLRELKSASKVTGLFSHITDEQITEAEEDDKGKPPSPEELGLGSAASANTGPQEGHSEKGTPPNGGRRSSIRSIS